MEAEDSSKQILDYLKIFFNFLLGRLQRHGAEITDIFMLWPLLDTDGVRNVFRDSIIWFGFKERDIPSLKLFLAAVCKYHKDTIGSVMTEQSNFNTKTDSTNTGNQTDTHLRTDESYATVRPDESYTVVKPSAATEGDCVAIEKYVFSKQAAVPIHDAPVEEVLKSGDVAESIIDMLDIDDELRSVLKKMIATVLFTLNVGEKTVTGLYEKDKDLGNASNNAINKNDYKQETATESINFTESSALKDDTSAVVPGETKGAQTNKNINKVEQILNALQQNSGIKATHMNDLRTNTNKNNDKNDANYQKAAEFNVSNAMYSVEEQNILEQGILSEDVSDGEGDVDEQTENVLLYEDLYK